MHQAAPHFYAQFPSQEARVSRKSLLRTLGALVAQLDKAPEVSMPTYGKVNSPSEGDDSFNQVTATGMWVTGDIAYGASSARRLEVLLEFTAPNLAYLNHSQVILHLLGFNLNVKVYAGRPEMNETGGYCSRAVKVWGPNLDSAAALNQLELMPTGTPPAKLFPLADDQLDMSPLERMALKEKIKSGVITSKFYPLDEVVDPVLTTSMLGPKQELIRDAELVLPDPALDLTAAIYDYFRLVELCGAFRSKTTINADECYLQHGSAIVFPGRGIKPNVALLDQTLISSIAYIPELSEKGPNGFWVLERGPIHPLRKAVQGLAAWAKTDVMGVLTVESSQPAGFDYVVSSLTLHQSSTAAEKAIDDGGAYACRSKLLEGEQLLLALSLADAVSIGDFRIPMTLEGTHLGTGFPTGLPGVIKALQDIAGTVERSARPSAQGRQSLPLRDAYAAQLEMFKAAFPALSHELRRIAGAGGSCFKCPATATAWDGWLKCLEANKLLENSSRAA